MNASGPLVARWLTVEHAPVEAGTLSRMTVEVENAGSAPWRTRGVEDGLFLSYHWLDERGNPIVWDGLRTPLGEAVEPGARVRRELDGARADSARPLPVRRRPRRGASLLARRARQPALRGGRRRRAARCRPAPGSTAPSRARSGSSAHGSSTARATRPSAARSTRRGLPDYARRRRAAPALPAPARLPVAPAAARAERRGRGTAGLQAGGRRAVHVRRAARAQTSIAI